MSKLSDKIAEIDPAGVLSESEIVAILNAPDPNLTPKKRVDVATENVREIMLGTQTLAEIELKSQNAALPDALRKACLTALRTITGTTLIRATDPTVYGQTVALLGALSAEGVDIIPPAVAAACVALADADVSWAERENVLVNTTTVFEARENN